MKLGFAVASVAVAASAFAATLAVGGRVVQAPSPQAAVAAPAPADAAAFVRKVVRLLADDRYTQAWPLLHPEHRRAVGRARYAGCEQLSPIPGRLLSVTTGTAFDAPVRLGPRTVSPSRAVPVRIVLLDLATREQTVVEDTVHAIRVGGRWTWILPPERLARYRAGVCPDAAPQVPGADL
jgi:hypothetical protein